MSEAMADMPVGQRVQLPGHFVEAVVLEDARPLGSGYEIRVRLPSGRLEEAVITAEEAAGLALSSRAPTDTIEPVVAGHLRLLVESARIRLAYAYDRQFAVSLSGIKTLPHQVEAVYGKMLRQPCLRFLLADDPGAGKTIMAGLLIKEMKLREAIERVLVLCPAPLTIQWQDEMQRWFQEVFEIIDSAVDQQQLTNPWQQRSQVIASLDYAKQPDVRERIWQQRWDLLIIDEAHKCSARTTSGGRGREQKVDPTRRYELASRLTRDADHVLLLTATPHHGDEDKFAHFLRLIDPDLFPEPHRLGPEAAEIRRRIFRLGADCPWSLRRLKEDLVDLRGNPLFPPRNAITVQFALDREEFDLYKATTAYINKFIPHRTGGRRTSAALARTVLQRRLASSACAIHESLRRRRQKQTDLLEELEALPPEKRRRRIAQLMGLIEDAELEEDDLDESARDQLVDSYTEAVELDQIRQEIAVLEDLVEQARRVREQARDSKLAALRECLGRAQFDELSGAKGRLLLFTEHRDTLNYLRENLDRWGYSTCEIHGGMNPHQRKAAQERFRREAKVCVATEAAGEGINLQFCHLMINYDLPWNPTRLEQRMGRIHRIGQDREVFAYNFVATQSEDGAPVIEGQILNRLLEKIAEMGRALEGRVFDVIGEVLSLNAVDLPAMLREAACEPGRLGEFIDQIDGIDPDKLSAYEQETGIALARGFVDFSSFQARDLEIEERRLMPSFVEEQFRAAAELVGLRVEQRADGLLRIEHVPADLRSERRPAVKRLGAPESSYRKVTFDKRRLEEDAHIDAVLTGPGHSLYAVVDERLNEELAPLVGGVGVYVDEAAEAPYQLHFFEIAVRGTDTHGRDVPLHGELVVIREEGEACEKAPPDALINLPAHPNPPPTLAVVDLQRAMDHLKATLLMERRRRCQEERQEVAQTIEEYLRQSFKARIDRAQSAHMRLKAEHGNHPDYALATDEAKRLVEDLERSRDDRLQGVQRLHLARTGPVAYLASALVLPATGDAEELVAALVEEPDPDVRRRSELAAEEQVIEWLVAEGFPPDRIERVGAEKIGFDIRAHRVIDERTGALDVRRVEVKGRQSGGPILLTSHEWYTAKQLASTYWLGVVWDPLSDDPQLDVVQNPAERLDHAKREIVVARRYEIPAAAVREAGATAP